jgi:hypothetical protein
MKKFIGLLIFEILTVIIAMSAFKLISDPLVAGAIAGGCFTLLGLVIFVMGLRDARFRRSITFVMGCVHLFLVAIPLMSVRFLNSAMAFGEIKIWGLSGPTFHRLSGVVFWMLMIGGVIDAIVFYKKMGPFAVDGSTVRKTEL